MINYVPARLQTVMPKDNEFDFNPEQEMMDEERIFDEVFENDLWEHTEGGNYE